MAHRRVFVYNVPDLAASTVMDDAKPAEGGEGAKSAGGLPPTSSRESALKFMTRSVACMADGKGKLSSIIFSFPEL